MNHTIIKKALNEALTQKYYDELMGSEDEEHIFGVGFTADMKRLIRKTDDKLLYYAKYAAIAACACIAIGCAVLLPNLINSGIDVEPPVTTTSEVEIATTPNETTLPIIITTTEGTTTEITTLPPVIETSPTGITEEIDDTNPGQGFETTATTSSPATETEKNPETEDDVHPGRGSDADEEIGDEENESDGDIIVDDDEDSAATLPEEGEDVVLDEDDAEIEADEEVEIEEDTDIDCDTDEDDITTDSDDDVVIEDDGDDVIIEEDDEYTEPVPLLSATLGEAVGELIFGDPYTALNGKIHTNRLTYMKSDGEEAENTYDFYETEVNLDFITQYLLNNSDAPRCDTEGDFGQDFLFLYVSDYPCYKPVFYDGSRRNNYDQIFSLEDVVEEEDDEADDEAGYYSRTEIRLTVYRNDIIEVWRSGYITAAFEVDTSELFKTLDSKGFKNEPKTVGNIITGLNLTADNMQNVYAEISDLYDLSMYRANFDTSAEKKELISYLTKLKSKKLTMWNNFLTYTHHASVTFSVANNPTKFEIVLWKDRLYFTDDNTAKKWYYTDITQSELEEFINLICKSENLKTPVYYKNMTDYVKASAGSFGIEQVEYSRINGAGYKRYSMSETNKIKEFKKLLDKGFKSAEYDPFYNESHGVQHMLVYTDKSVNFRIYENDTIQILGSNWFKAPSGYYKELISYIEGNTKAMDVEVETDDVEVEIDDDLDEAEVDPIIECD